MKALSFLGAGRYQTVTYYFGDKECTTNLFPEAVARIFEPEELVIFVTPESKKAPKDEKKKYVNVLEERLGSVVRFEEIPEGRTEEELWAIFDKCVDVVKGESEILLDITHAFRSIPLVVFTVALYLRKVRDVKISGIIYGAYEARSPYREPPKPSDRAPVFDLSLLLDLVEWMSGAEALMKYLNAETLSEKLKTIHKSLWREKIAEPRMLERLARKLNGFSNALLLNRPIESMKSAQELLPLLREARHEIEKWSKPFTLVVEKVEDWTGALAHPEPEILSAENLRKQLSLIELYIHHGLVLQAVTLAREWVVSYVCAFRGYDWLDYEKRREVESTLNSAIERKKGEHAKLPEWFDELPTKEELLKAWSKVRDLRNDLTHCGMRRDARGADDIIKNAKEMLEFLKPLQTMM